VDEVTGVETIVQPTAFAMEKFSETFKMRLEDLKQKSRKVPEELRKEVND
jgi:hypothetical protein